MKRWGVGGSICILSDRFELERNFSIVYYRDVKDPSQIFWNTSFDPEALNEN